MRERAADGERPAAVGHGVREVDVLEVTLEETEPMY